MSRNLFLSRSREKIAPRSFPLEIVISPTNLRSSFPRILESRPSGMNERHLRDACLYTLIPNIIADGGNVPFRWIKFLSQRWNPMSSPLPDLPGLFARFDYYHHHEFFFARRVSRERTDVILIMTIISRGNVKVHLRAQRRKSEREREALVALFPHIAMPREETRSPSAVPHAGSYM